MGRYLARGGYLSRAGPSRASGARTEYEPITGEGDAGALGRARGGGGWRWGRGHLAVVNAYRAVAFRTVVRIPVMRGAGGGGGYEMNVAEAVLTAVYLFVVFRWSFAHSAYIASGFRCFTRIFGLGGRC